jgi:ABC-2 type transport system ATP-binding protein
MGSIAIRCTGLVKRYGGLTAVDGIDLEIRAGECFGLLGPNGAGKTTTIEILEGLLEPDAGEVEILGMRWDGRNDRALRDRLGIQLQETRLNDKLTVEETLQLFRSFYSKGRPAPAVLRLVELDSKRTSRVARLSGGQKQRLAVACALVGLPELLFLDEPTTGFDPQSRRQLWEMLAAYRREGGTILLTTHYMEEAEALCDRVAIMDHGRIITLGSPTALVGTLGAGNVIEFTADDGQPPAGDMLRALPGVKDVRSENGSTALVVEHLHLALPALLAALERHGTRLSMLTTHHATLEDVFVSLTGRRLRDD